MKKLEAFEKLAEKGIFYVIKRMRRKFKDNFVAFIVYGSYATKDFTLNSDVDCLAIFLKNIKKEVNPWLFRFLAELDNWLDKQPKSKVLRKFRLRISIYPNTLRLFKKSCKKGDPSTLDIIQSGKLYFPGKKDLVSFFNIKPKISEKKYLETTFEKDVKNLLTIYVRQFIKKCLLVARRIYFTKTKKQLKKEEISKIFDKEFKNISNRVSLVKLNQFLNKDLNKLEIKELTEIISKCNKFLILIQKFSKK